MRASLAENDLTVVSIFVNPAQFAPTEDLASYPRTLAKDVEALQSLVGPNGQAKGVSAVFAPTVPEMYPSPDGKSFTQHVQDQTGAFVEVQGLQAQMEGRSRPTFFRGVATVCTKLFNIVQPTLAYFGQKDIQQAIILRRLVLDLRFTFPPGPSAVRVIPTERDPNDQLALSSRNAYLTRKARPHATALYRALSEGQKAWDSSPGEQASTRIENTLKAARDLIQAQCKRAKADGIWIDPLYISLNDPISLEPLEEVAVKDSTLTDTSRGAILSGAAMIKEGEDGRATRLIDNILLGFSLSNENT